MIFLVLGPHLGDVMFLEQKNGTLIPKNSQSDFASKRTESPRRGPNGKLPFRLRLTGQASQKSFRV